MSNTIISYTENNETFAMDPHTIDIDIIAKTDRVLVKGWLPVARDSIESILQERFQYYLQRPSDAIVTAAKKNYCPDNYKDIAEKYGMSGKRSQFLHGLVYLATRYSVSCHELLFGMARPVELFGRTKSFLLTITAVQDTFFQNKLRQHLQENVLNTNSPLFIVRERCFEAGYAQGMRYHDICRLDFGSPTLKEIMRQMYAPDFSFRAEDHTGSVAAHRPAFDMVLRDCRKYQVSADYLLLQDYSERALLNGKGLTPEQQEWLSLYLCATPDAQVVAIGMLMKYLLNHCDQQTAGTEN